MENTKKGFTLLELLIVIAIIVLLGIILIFALNPAETLAKSRDAQRISDLSTMKTALGVFTTTIGSPDLDASATVCLADAGADRTGATGGMIAYSVTSVTLCNAAAGAQPAEGTDTTGEFVNDAAMTDWCYQAPVAANNTLTDGTGWLPVNLNSITGGSPISSLPVDPTNTVADPTAPGFNDYVYRYACQNDAPLLADYVFELNARLESAQYATTDNLDGNDGGDETSLYEVGTSVRLMGDGALGVDDY